jgi:PAS domain S-box-containing protein
MPGPFLILAPRGRDAEVITRLLERADVSTRICADAAELDALLGADIQGMIATEEALANVDMDPVLEWCESQPPWSDLPVLVLATRQPARRPERVSQLIARLCNVMLLERPLKAETLLSAVRMALRARKRQYQARALLAEEERASADLRSLNETLEEHVRLRTRELEGARETLSVALESAEMGSWDIDLLGDVARVSEQHDRIFGLQSPSPDWSREAFLARVDNDDAALASQAFEDAVQSGVLDLECRIRRPDGSLRWIAAKGRVRCDDERRPTRMAGIVMDITERKRADEAMRQAQKMESIGQLTGGVAHDFNNLLAAILSNLDLVRKRVPDMRTAQLVDGAIKGSERGAVLTRRLLAFARRQDLKTERVNIPQLFAGIGELLSSSVGPGVRIESDLPPQLPDVSVDVNQLELALLNLAVNARDAMPQGGVLRISAQPVHVPPATRTHRKLPEDIKEGHYVCITVADTGEGMDEHTLKRAAEPFFTTKGVGKGTGLGLSMVQGLAMQSGGAMRIESFPGQGVKVHLWLPQADPMTEARPPDAPELLQPQAPDPLTILVVDDDALVAMGTVAMLEDLGHVVLEAHSGNEALKILDGNSTIDLIVTDHAMPGMTGAELARIVHGRWPGLSMILATGYAELPNVEDPRLPRLSKPFRQEDIAQLLDAIFYDKQS